MNKSLRLLALAAALNVTLAGVCAAQTVVVRHAPPGETIDVVLNDAAAGTGTVDPNGDATVAAALATPLAKEGIEANIFVDACDKRRRVSIASRGTLPPALEPSCTRREISGLYWIRPISTVVVDVGGPNPTVLLRQSGYSLTAPSVRGALPAGLQVFAGSGLTTIRDAAAIACGSAAPCNSHQSGVPYSAGVTYWLTRFIAVEASFVQPAKVKATGSGTGFHFDSSLDVPFVTIGGKAGVGAGPVRFYATGGANFQRSAAISDETIDERTITIADVPQTIPGGTQRFELRTSGWGWQVGGGMEVWVAGPLAIYAEVGRATLKGTAGVGEGRLDERVRFIIGGLRLHLGG
jgi:hypothetical protein